MKKLLIILVAFWFASHVTAQTINDVPIDSIKVEYLGIVGYSKLMSLTKVSIVVDYGQKRTVMTDIRLKNEEGRPVVLNGMIDALNFFAKYGWEYCDAYVVTAGQSNVYHYIMKRKD